MLKCSLYVYDLKFLNMRTLKQFFFFALVSQSYEALLQQRLNAEIREICEVKYNLLAQEYSYSYYLSEAAQSQRK